MSQLLSTPVSRPASELRDVRLSYRLILSRIIHALAVPGWKSAAFRTRHRAARSPATPSAAAPAALLHHGTLLYAFDAESWAVSERTVCQPGYRARRLMRTPGEPISLARRSARLNELSLLSAKGTSFS